MKHLIFFVHGDEQVKPKYLAKLSGIQGIELVFVNAGGYSSAYQQLARSLRNDSGMILPRLVAKYASSPDLGAWTTISFVSFSAGYALVREVLKREAALVNAYVAIDSIHDDLQYSQCDIWEALARRAQTNQCLFWLGHTDVPTPQTGKGAFTSTTQIAQWLARRVIPGGKFHIQAFDLKKDPREEHIAALNEWGPQFVADALIPHLGGSVALTNPPPASITGRQEWLDPSKTYGERCVLLSLAELKSGVQEEPQGSNTGKRIREYLAPCTRNGAMLGLKAGAWCAASACWVAERCRMPGETPPHLYRCSGQEMEQDAMNQHAWVDVETVRGGGMIIEVGDVAMYSRGTPAWQRHVTRVLEVPDTTGKFKTIAGNENDRWQITARSLSDKDLLGFIRYPKGKS